VFFLTQASQLSRKYLNIWQYLTLFHILSISLFTVIQSFNVTIVIWIAEGFAIWAVDKQIRNGRSLFSRLTWSSIYQDENGSRIMNLLTYVDIYDTCLSACSFGCCSLLFSSIYCVFKSRRDHQCGVLSMPIYKKTTTLTYANICFDLIGHLQVCKLDLQGSCCCNRFFLRLILCCRHARVQCYHE
jgi:hypothetical protein